MQINSAQLLRNVAGNQSHDRNLQFCFSKLDGWCIQSEGTGKQIKGQGWLD